jgi:hypothetical protein
MCLVQKEPLWDIFTPDVVASWRRMPNPTESVKLRLKVVGSGGLNPNFPNRPYPAYKAAWERYPFAAFACGLFQGPHGKDLRARLVAPSDDNFRSALSECLAAWYLAGRLHLPLRPRPAGQGQRVLEFIIEHVGGNINVEVKAPNRAIRANAEFFCGGDEDLLESALDHANRQFPRDTRNLLVIVPSLRLPVLETREEIEKVFIGEHYIQIPIDPLTDGTAGEERIIYRDDVGKFTKPWPSKKSAFGPRFTRVGAALFLDDDYVEHGTVSPKALIVRNPNALKSLPRDLWGSVPEFFLDKNRWRWSDIPLAG